MDVSVVLEQRFERTPDGTVWTPQQFPYSFWQTYLHVFDTVRVVARVKDVAVVPDTWLRVTGEQVEIGAIPYYLGPIDYLKKRRRVSRALSGEVTRGRAYILRLSSQLGNVIVPRLMQAQIPYGVQVVCDPHDAFAPEVMKHPLAPLFRTIFPRKLRQCTQRACATAYVTEEHLQRRYPCPRLSIAASDVDLKDEDFWLAPRNNFSSPLKVMFVGSLAQPYKGCDVLLNAFAKCIAADANLELVIAGDGKCKPALEDLSRSLGIAERVAFTGNLPGARAVRDYLDRSDIFCLPSRTEGLPRAVVEAMARALPCLASKVGGIPELLAEEDLVPAGKVDALADKLLEVSKSPARLAAMSARNLSRARDFHHKKLLKRHFDFFEAVKEAAK